MGGTVTSPSRCSPTPSSPPSGPKAGTSRRHSHKKGLQKRRPRTAFLHSRESEGSRGADGLRSAKAPVPIGLVSTTSILPRSTLLVGVASSPSGGSQTLPLQTERRAAGMNYNCSIKDQPSLRKKKQSSSPTRVTTVSTATMKKMTIAILLRNGSKKKGG